MNILESSILGIVQGLTEFLPISSSGHLIIFRDLLNQQVVYGLAFDAVLQLSTTFAIAVYFHKDILNIFLDFIQMLKDVIALRKDFSGNFIKIKKNISFVILISSIPAIFFGLILEKYMDSVFRDSLYVALFLLIGSILMYFAEKKWKKHELQKKLKDDISIKDGLFIGFFQSLALLPGMSRSGMTISGALISGISREKAVRFSFILALPILLGSGFKKLLEIVGNNGLLNQIGMELFWGCVFAFISGLLAIHFLIKFLKNHTLNIFIFYRLALVLIIIFSIVFN